MLLYIIMKRAMRNNNNSFDNGLGALDALSIVSFIIGWFNFLENLDQTTMQDTVQSAVNDIHKHLELQDIKMDRIIDMLGGEVSER